MKVVIPVNELSWVPGADSSWFPIQNLPYGRIWSDEGIDSNVVRIGEYVVDLSKLVEAGLFGSDYETADPSIIAMTMGIEALAAFRTRIWKILKADHALAESEIGLVQNAIIPLNEVFVDLPMTISAFVDFYSGIHHASNVGKMFRPDQPPLMPNYRHIPIGYNGRASSVVASNQPVIRPHGQTKGPNDEFPTFGPTNELDFELEMGFFTHSPTDMGRPIAIENAEDLILGLCMVNDWSARDMQRWEYQPLGPFLAKSFATSISPWIVPLDSLEYFRCDGIEQDPKPLDYLDQKGQRGYDIQLDVWIQTSKSRRPQRICHSNSKYLYWSFVQQLAHQSSNGTPISDGDLYASGTISGPEPEQSGSLLELSWRGTKPILIEETGETRTFLEDGDTITMRGWAEHENFTIGLGEVTGTVLSLQQFDEMFEA